MRGLPNTSTHTASSVTSTGHPSKSEPGLALLNFTDLKATLFTQPSVSVFLISSYQNSYTLAAITHSSEESSLPPSFFIFNYLVRC